MYYRAMINQPSTLQEFYKYHGKIGVVVKEESNGIVEIVFCDGPVISMRIPKLCISKV